MSRMHTAGWGRRGVMALTTFLGATLLILAEGAALARADGSPSPAASPAGGGISSTMWYVIGLVVAFGGALLVVLLKRRGDGGAVEE